MVIQKKVVTLHRGKGKSPNGLGRFPEQKKDKNMEQKFMKGGNEGMVMEINTTIGPRVLATTAAKSKTFKTWLGAVAFMNRNGYYAIFE